MLSADRLRQLRLSRGLSLEDLATEMGGIVTKQAISKYESAKAQPSVIVLTKLAAALNVKASALATNPPITIEFHGFRKRASLGKREQDVIENQVKQLLEDRSYLQSLFPPAQKTMLPIHQFKVSDLEDADDAAMKLRHMWSLGEAPIANVTNALEDWGIHVIELRDHAKFDGLSATIKNDDGNYTAGAVITAMEATGERQRFNLAHELGHLVLKVMKKLDEEDLANRFAGAFLAPKDALISATGKKRRYVTQQELFLLKEKFGMSLQALLYRMKDLGVIADTYYRQCCIEISKLGWRKNEPCPLRRETSTWLRQTVLKAVTEDLISKEDAERILGERLETEEPLTLKQRRAFMKLPLEERRKLIAKQARDLAEHYATDTEWREEEGGDIIDY
jgi:Zn-dependent peptidase ImmA (M78 family)/DNA-binding XRE family transcriptional regulator